jgi:hypothetical protein
MTCDRVGGQCDTRVEQSISLGAAPGLKLVGGHGVGRMEGARREAGKRGVLFFMCYMKLVG